MAVLSVLATLAPYHLLLYGTLLGTEVYQSFIMTKVCYNALHMSAFTTLQKRVFPVYFRAQTFLILLTIVTYPPFSLLSLAHLPLHSIPLAVAGFTALLNLIIYGPSTKKAMIDRIHQETTDGTKYNDPGITQEMKVKNRTFSRNHAMSIHLNLLTIGATIWHGIQLASKLKF